MSRISDYTEIQSTQGTTGLADNDVIYVDGTAGSRKITAVELANALFDKILLNADSTGVGYGKSGLYRGANLGSGTTFELASTEAQRAAIASGTFSGLFIGDYWTVNNVLYRIADFNFYKGIGENDFKVNHIILVPDDSFGSGKMNSTNITTGAYVGSEMYSDSSSILNTARTKIATDFGGYLATYRNYLPNATLDGNQSAAAYYDSTVELMNELMVYGCFIRTKPRSDGNHIPTFDKSQLALFRLNPTLVNPRYTYWLRDVASSTAFSHVSVYGAANSYPASYLGGVRPYFVVKGTSES